MDLDGDGLKDIISGGYPGEIYLFRGNGDGTFRAREELTNRYGETINVGKSSVPFACDWDRDGDLDLLVGNIEGHVYLIPNASDDVFFKYGVAERLTAGGELIDVGTGDAGPCVADWDGDGDHDLLLGGQDGSVLFFRNRSSDDVPELEAPTFLVPAGGMFTEMGEEGTVRFIGGRTKVCVTDWNGDGRDDLLAGVYALQSRAQSQLEPGEQEEFERLGLELKELQQRQKEIDREIKSRILKDLGVPENERPPREIMAEYLSRWGNAIMGHSEYRELSRRLQEVSRARDPFERKIGNPYENHGWVWVFLRKDTARFPGVQRR